MSFLVSPVGASTSSFSSRSTHRMSRLYQRCSPASNDVLVEGLQHSPGQERHAEWLMWARIGVWIAVGLAIDTVSFCGWAPCHAEDALCENTSCKMPSSRMGNFFVMSSSMASQSTLALATRIGWKPSALMFHFWIRQVTSRAREPLAASLRSKMCGSRTIGLLARQVTFRF